MNIFFVLEMKFFKKVLCLSLYFGLLLCRVCARAYECHLIFFLSSVTYANQLHWHPFDQKNVEQTTTKSDGKFSEMANKHGMLLAIDVR